MAGGAGFAIGADTLRQRRDVLRPTNKNPFSPTSKEKEGSESEAEKSISPPWKRQPEAAPAPATPPLRNVKHAPGGPQCEETTVDTGRAPGGPPHSAVSLFIILLQNRISLFAATTVLKRKLLTPTTVTE